VLDTSLRGFALQKKCLSEIGVISESPRAGDPVNLTQDAQHTVSIAKIGVWNMHLPQIKGQIECAAAAGSVPYKTTDMPQDGAQQVVG